LQSPASGPVRHAQVYASEDAGRVGAWCRRGQQEEEAGRRIIGADLALYQDLGDLIRACQHHDSQVQDSDASCFIGGEYVTAT